MIIRLKNIVIYFLVVTMTTIAGYFIGRYLGDILIEKTVDLYLIKPSDNFICSLLYLVTIIPLIILLSVIINFISTYSGILGIIVSALLGFITTGVWIEEHLEKKIIRLYNEGSSLEKISAVTGENKRKIDKILSKTCQPIDYQI